MKLHIEFDGNELNIIHDDEHIKVTYNPDPEYASVLIYKNGIVMGALYTPESFKENKK